VFRDPLSKHAVRPISRWVAHPECALFRRAAYSGGRVSTLHSRLLRAPPPVSPNAPVVVSLTRPSDHRDPRLADGGRLHHRTNRGSPSRRRRNLPSNRPLSTRHPPPPPSRWVCSRSSRVGSAAQTRPNQVPSPGTTKPGPRPVTHRASGLRPSSVFPTSIAPTKKKLGERGARHRGALLQANMLLPPTSPWSWNSVYLFANERPTSTMSPVRRCEQAAFQPPSVRVPSETRQVRPSPHKNPPTLKPDLKKDAPSVCAASQARALETPSRTS